MLRVGRRNVVRPVGRSGKDVADIHQPHRLCATPSSLAGSFAGRSRYRTTTITAGHLATAQREHGFSIRSSRWNRMYYEELDNC